MLSMDMSPVAGRVPGDQLQDTKHMQILTCLTCDLNKRKSLALHRKYSDTYKDTCCCF